MCQIPSNSMPQKMSIIGPGLSGSLVYLAFEPWIACVHDELAGWHAQTHPVVWNYRISP